MRRALAIDEASYGPGHPRVAVALNNLALLLRATNRHAEAERLYRRALAIAEASHGPARSLTAGETVEAIASARRVSQNTIRTHVRGVLEKTGCNRQADIVALLSAISSTRLTNPI
jgi:DNA-binding NarL/FixJ family response regulator